MFIVTYMINNICQKHLELYRPQKSALLMYTFTNVNDVSVLILTGLFKLLLGDVSKIKLW